MNGPPVFDGFFRSRQAPYRTGAMLLSLLLSLRAVRRERSVRNRSFFLGWLCLAATACAGEALAPTANGGGATGGRSPGRLPVGGSGGGGSSTGGDSGMVGISGTGGSAGSMGPRPGGPGQDSAPVAAGDAGATVIVRPDTGMTGDASAPSSSACSSGGLAGPGHVRITKTGTTFSLTRDGAPYYIKGFAGQTRMAIAQTAGANSTRTFSSNAALEVLDGARSRCMTVMLGIQLSQKPEDYEDPAYTAGKRAEVAGLLSSVADHPALLMWALGNEINLGADNQTAWTFVGQLAQLIHSRDPNHPVITVLAGANTTAIDHVVQWATGIDAIGINSYAGVTNVQADVARSTFTGPIIISEWGPTGHWESPKTMWDRPIEQTSAEKAQTYASRYDYIYQHRSRILGSYVFLWGQKVERTPTWYGIFLETSDELGLAGQSLPTLDVMIENWSGVTPSNRAPNVTALTLAGKKASDSATFAGGQTVQGQVTASDPDADALSFSWEILQDPAQPELNGAAEARLPRIGMPQRGTSPTFGFTTPAASGQYRLFVYVLDGKGHAGTANMPFRVN